MTFQAKFYAGTRPGLPGIYNRAVRAWERGSFSHCELLFSDGLSGSASFMDHGVRIKAIDYAPDRWVTIDLPGHLEEFARQWFTTHQGVAYDLMGNVHLVVGFLPQSKSKYFCSEALMAALGYPNAWRLGPNAAYDALAWRFHLA